MKNKLIALSFVVVLYSCTEPIDLDLNNGENGELVVDAWLDNTDREQIIKLSLTSDYFNDTMPDEASGAIIQLQGGGQTLDFEELENGRYRMIGRVDGMYGTSYTLNVSFDGIMYTAQQTLKRLPVPEFSYRKDKDPRPTIDFIYLFDLTVHEPDGIGDHYFFNSFEKKMVPELSLLNSTIVSDEYFDGSLIEDAFITRGYFETGDQVIVQMRSISEEAYDYINIVGDQTVNRGEIFDAPPANVPTNISGNAKGFFILSAIAEAEFVVD